jgi:hypothetical protein
VTDRAFDVAQGRAHTFNVKGKRVFLCDRSVEDLHHEFIQALEQRADQMRRDNIAAQRLAKEARQKKEPSP